MIVSVRQWLCVLSVSLFAAGCMPAASDPATTTLAASATPPTDTPVFVPVDTAVPTLTPTDAPTPTLTPAVIGFDNVEELLVGAVSVGDSASDLVWLDDGSAVVVATD